LCFTGQPEEAVAAAAAGVEAAGVETGVTSTGAGLLFFPNPRGHFAFVSAAALDTGHVAVGAGGLGGSLAAAIETAGFTAGAGAEGSTFTTDGLAVAPEGVEAALPILTIRCLY
jgi:hypothetical protein